VPGAGVGFELERFGALEGELEVAGRWHGLTGARLRRPRLALASAEGRVVLIASEFDARPGPDGAWQARFAASGLPATPVSAELDVGRNVVVELPAPDLRPAAVAVAGADAPPGDAGRHTSGRRTPKRPASRRPATRGAMQAEIGQESAPRPGLAGPSEPGVTSETVPGPSEPDVAALEARLQARSEEAVAQAARLAAERDVARTEVDRLADEVRDLQAEVESLRAEERDLALEATNALAAREEELEQALQTAGEATERLSARETELEEARRAAQEAAQRAQAAQEEAQAAEARAQVAQEAARRATADARAARAELVAGRAGEPGSRGAQQDAPAPRAPTATARQLDPGRPLVRPPKPPAAVHRTARHEPSRAAVWATRIAAFGLLALLVATLRVLLDGVF
jgi:hypothetical protein